MSKGSLLKRIVEIWKDNFKGEYLKLLPELLKNNPDSIFDIDERSEDGILLLSFLIDDYYVEALEYILGKYLDPSAKFYSGRSILDFAVKNEQYKCVELLLRHNANIDVKDSRGYTPLHSAVIRNDKKMVKLLLSYNADTLIKSNSGRLASDLATGECQRLILEHQDLPPY